MHRLTLLHIGDVHYDRTKGAISVDAKDSGFPKSLGDSAVSRPLQAVIRKLIRLSDDAHGAVIVGDLTTGGSLDTYEECVDYLSTNLRLEDSGRWQRGAVVVVPGNHDVDRELVDDRDLMAKFAPLEGAWEPKELPVLAARVVHTTVLGDPTTGQLQLTGLNSSIGCGERRLLEGGLPEEIAAALHQLVSDFAESTQEDLFGEQSEILDTPAFLEEHVVEVAELVNELSIHALPVLVAHHNLVPQALPRLAPYAELVNGGMFRSRLAAAGRPVVYLHGHIHTDPVEVVTQHSPNSGSLILISAPLITKGFNVLHVEYTGPGYPMGLVVECWRVSDDGGVGLRDTIRIPLETRIDTAGPITRGLVDALANSPLLRFNELRQRLGATAEGFSDEELADAVLEAEWLGMVNVDDREQEIHRWRIRGRLS